MITSVKSIDSIPVLIEIIQIDVDIELLRPETLPESSFMIINSRMYDYIMAWNSSINMHHYLKMKEPYTISLTSLFM
jgi:hypothetical protein